MSDEQTPMSEPVSTPSQGMVYSFFGSYRHAMDLKGRIIIPNPYREMLGESFVISTTRDFMGVALYPTPVFESIVRDIESLNQRKPVVQKIREQFYKYSYPASTADAQGRILLPTALRQQMLGDAKEVEISGDHDCIRIKNAEASTREDQFFFEHLSELLNEFGDLTD